MMHIKTCISCESVWDKLPSEMYKNGFVEREETTTTATKYTAETVEMRHLHLYYVFYVTDATVDCCRCEWYDWWSDEEKRTKDKNYKKLNTLAQWERRRCDWAIQIDNDCKSLLPWANKMFYSTTPLHSLLFVLLPLILSSQLIIYTRLSCIQCTQIKRPFWDTKKARHGKTERNKYNAPVLLSLSLSLLFALDPCFLQNPPCKWSQMQTIEW